MLRLSKELGEGLMRSISCATRRLCGLAFTNAKGGAGTTIPVFPAAISHGVFLFLVLTALLIAPCISNPAYAAPQWRVLEIARAGLNGANSPGLLTWYDSRAAACKGNGEAWIRHCKSLPNSCLGNWTTADVPTCENDPLCSSYCAQYHDGVENASYSYDGRNADTANPNNLGGCPTNPDASAPSVGNPCNAATGNKFQTETDFRVHDNFSLDRHYNSDLALNIRDVGLGVGWTLGLTSVLELANATTLRHRSPTGKAQLFTNSAGTWQANADVRMTLAQTASGYTVAYPDGALDVYDVTGKQISRTDRAGRTITYAYAANDQLVSAADYFGHALTFTYGATGHLATITDASGQSISYVYALSNGYSMLTRVDYPDGSAKQHHYENPLFPAYLTGISYVDTSGVATRYATYSYDTAGRAILTEHAAGMERFTLQYDSPTQTTVRDATNLDEVMAFQANLGLKNLVTRVNQVDGKSLNQLFDTRNNLTCKKDEEGHVVLYTYNATNQKSAMTEGLTGTCAAPVTTAATRTTTYQYLAPTLDLPTLISVPSVYTGQTKTTAIAYGNSALPNLPTSITQSGFTSAGNSVSRTVSLQYNSFGQVTRIDGPRTDVADVTTLAYNECTTGGACGQLASITNALGQVTHFDTYDANGRLVQMTDANGLRTTYQYDPRGRVRVVTQTPPAGAARISEYRYSAAGDVIFAGFPDGRTLGYQYSAARKLLRVTDNLGNYLAYGYDLKGNRTQEYTYDPAGTLVRQIDTAFDHRNHLASINAAGSLSQQLHDAVGNLVQATDPKQNPPTQHQYDALNRLLSTVDALGGATTYGYDVNDRLSQAASPNSASTQYRYDDLGNLLEETSPDRGISRYTHDTAGNVRSLTDARGITASYNYDALNRVTQIVYPDVAENVTFTYDAGANCTLGIGRLCRAQDESGVTEYGYDAYGNVVTQIKQELNRSYITRYTYDAADRTATLTYPDGRTLAYTRDGVGRIQSVSTTVNGATQTLVSGRAYRADGLFTSQNFGNGLNEARQYDLQGRLTAQFVGSADTRVYDYDPNGNVTRKQSLPDVASYTYDALDRVTAETTLGDSNVFGYDANGNRTSDLNANGNPRSYLYAPSANRLTQVGNQAVATDAAGYTLSDRNGSRMFGWNNAGRLRTVTRQSVVRGTYVYNYLGQRTQKTRVSANGGSARFVYHHDLAGNVIGETRPNGNLVRLYVWADQDPIAQIQNRPALGTEELVYVHTDPLATPRFATNADQAVVWRFESEAFGTGRPDVDPDENESSTNVRLRFAGQYADGESGLFYNWNRYYDPRTGRYITSDPIGLEGGPNTYLYARANPLKFIDPTGLLCVYSQSTGSLSCTDDNTGEQYLRCNGYAGRGSGLNNSNAQNQPFVGPLPQGDYTVGGPNNRRGPSTRPLTPDPANNMFGRNGFLIHGDNAARNNTGSEGCPVLPRDCRDGIPTGETFRVGP